MEKRLNWTSMRWTTAHYTNSTNWYVQIQYLHQHYFPFPSRRRRPPVPNQKEPPRRTVNPAVPRRKERHAKELMNVKRLNASNCWRTNSIHSILLVQQLLNPLTPFHHQHLLRLQRARHLLLDQSSMLVRVARAKVRVMMRVIESALWYQRRYVTFLLFSCVFVC